MKINKNHEHHKNVRSHKKSQGVITSHQKSKKTESPKTVTTKTTEVVEFTAEEVEAIKAENEKLKTELAKAPADAPVTANKFSTEKPVLSRKDYKKLSRQERFLYNLNK